MYERLGGTPGPEDGMPQSMDIGTVLVPTLMVCGTDDPYILCSNDYVANRTTPELVPDYEVVLNHCGHLVISKCRSMTSVTTWNVWAEDEGYRAILAITEYLERRVIMAGWGVWLSGAYQHEGRGLPPTAAGSATSILGGPLALLRTIGSWSLRGDDF